MKIKYIPLLFVVIPIGILSLIVYIIITSLSELVEKIESIK